MTTAERTMLDRGRSDAVRAFRQEWQNEMGDRLIATVEQVTSRRVATYQSQVMFEPDTIELFLFEETAPEVAVHATADDRLAGTQ